MTETSKEAIDLALKYKLEHSLASTHLKGATVTTLIRLLHDEEQKETLDRIAESVERYVNERIESDKVITRLLQDIARLQAVDLSYRIEKLEDLCPRIKE